jgi:LPS sulfotransferase NodH
MIISHRHRYLFVELPRTGSTAIRRELRDLYDGEAILHKHATYDEFARVATEDERKYFVFSGVRNPLDDAVSQYFKVKTDHNSRMSDPSRAPKSKPILNRIVDRHIFGYLRRTDADFADYFMRYHVLPYDRWSSLSHDRFDFVIRFEHLADDFDEALRRIGIAPKRRLPQVNPTAARSRDWRDYYPPHTRARARRVFGPYMERWGYEFPAEWGVGGLRRSDRIGYAVFSAVAGVYWRYLRSVGAGSRRAP